MEHFATVANRQNQITPTLGCSLVHSGVKQQVTEEETRH